MAPRIAIPLPHSADLKYSERAIPQYEHAVRGAGGEPVRVPLDLSAEEVRKLVDQCDAVLLPGSNADVDPSRFHAQRLWRTEKADLRREAVDDLLLEDAYQKRKPVLGICYGLQSLNVHRRGSLIQHIPDFLPRETRRKVDHTVGKKKEIAHTVEIDSNSRLGRIAGQDGPRPAPGDGRIVIPVNSSHHQSADGIGEGLRIVARCVEDGIIEGLEGTSPDHFVLAVQWHPERSVDADEPSRAIFRALIEAAEKLR